jgi:hypothetical protein
MPVVVSDIIGEIQQVTGKCSQNYLFSVLTRAVETLARKSCATSVTWDPMLTYLDLPVVEDYYVFLPWQIEKPVKININSNPSFSHSQLYEFTMNGPGSSDMEAGWQWQDRGTGAIQRRFPRGAQTLTAYSDSESDTNVSLHMRVRFRDRSEGYIDLAVAPLGTSVPADTHLVIDVLEVVKPVTVGTIQLTAGPYTLAYYYPSVTFPQFMQIKLSQRAVMVRMLARKRTTQITSLLDVIPLNSAQAIKMMAQAIKYYDEVHYDLAATAEAQAVTFLNEEQAARNAYSQTTGTEISTALNLTIGQRDTIIVADIYDEACRIFGHLGRPKIFDQITSTLELLYNKAQWDGLIGYVDIRSDDDFYVALPRYVDQIIALNVNGQRGVFRNKWFEFNLNSLGEFCDQQQDPRQWQRWDALVTTEKAGRCGCRVTPYGCFGTDGILRNNRPPYGWEEVGQTPLAFRLKGPAQLVAIPELAQDNNAILTVYGYDENDNPVITRNGNWGIEVPCRKSSLRPTKQIFARIERITKDPTYGFISLYALNPYSAVPAPHYAEGVVPGAQLEFLSLYWPQDTEPVYRLIRIGTFCKRIRIRYRKNYLKISDLTDPIHIRNRTALILAMTGLAAMKQGAGASGSISAFMPTAGVQIAADQINMAVDMLNDEWRVSHPQEGITLQWDRRVYGNAFPQIL